MKQNIKSILALLLVLALTVPGMTSCASSKLTYAINEDGQTCTITGIDLLMNISLSVPSHIDGYRVTAIGSRAFADHPALQTVVLPAALTEIGSSAFSGSDVTTLQFLGTEDEWTAVKKAGGWNNGMPSYTLVIGDKLFETKATESADSTEKTQETKPSEHAHDFGEWILTKQPTETLPGEKSRACTLCGYTETQTFNIAPTQGLSYKLNPDAQSYSVSSYGVSKDTEIFIPSTYAGKPVTGISGGAFQFCDKLQTVIIPESVTSIGAQAFQFCGKLTNLILPSGLNKIGAEAFNGCQSLTSMVIPNSVRTIGDGAFKGCSSLTSITLPNRLMEISPFTFSNCTALKSISIPNGISSIGNGAFSNCSALESISIPYGIKELNPQSFFLCSSLEKISLPVTLTHISYDTFNGIAAKSIQYGGTQAQWKTVKKTVGWTNSIQSVVCTDGVTSP